jgi:amino acid transporter
MSAGQAAVDAPTYGSAPGEKGLRSGSLGLISSIVMGMASTAPAYSLASALGFVVATVALQSPIIMLLAFVPMYMIAVAYKELNEAEPDCGTTFTWATRAFGASWGWMGGWGIFAADVIVMANLAQIAGSYGFLLVGANHLANSVTWVTVAGITWIIVMTWISWIGIEISAKLQYLLLGIEIVILGALAGTALVKVYTGNGVAQSSRIQLSWFNPLNISSPGVFAAGILAAIFIYWGWDTAVAVNEETKDKTKTPGRAAILSTFILLVTYALVILSMESFAGIKTTGNGLGNLANAGDVLSVQGSLVFGTSAFGSFLTHLLLLMVLSSAAASTQTTILPTARTTLSMAVYKAIPPQFAKINRKHLTPSVSTIVMGAISIVVYVFFNYSSNGIGVIGDAVIAIGLYIAFYYGLTGFACAWYYRKNLTSSARNLWMQGILPVLGGLILYFLGGWSVWLDYDVATANDYTMWTVPFIHWQIGGAFVIAVVAGIIGVAAYLYCKFANPAFFRKQTLTRATPTLVPEE